MSIKLINRLRTEEEIDLHEIMAAPGIEHIPPIVETSANTASEVLNESIQYYEWHYKDLINAIKPLDTYIEDKYVVPH